MKDYFEGEFFCGCGCGLGLDEMDEDFVMDLNMARSIAEVSFRLNSTIRCLKHNKAVGGSKTSSHLKGVAADIETRNAFERFQIFHGLKKAGFTRFGIYKTFIHVDGDLDKPKKLMWWK